MQPAVPPHVEPATPTYLRGWPDWAAAKTLKLRPSPDLWRFGGCAFGVVLLGALSVYEPTTEYRCGCLIGAVLVLQLSGAVPLYCIGLLIPVLGTLFRALPERSPGETARECFASMMNPMTALVLGSFTVNSIFLSCQLEVSCVAWVARNFGDRPRTFLLVLMLVCMYGSAVTLITLLALAAVLPLCRPGGGDDESTKSVLIGVGFACTLGGMLTPIAGPPALILTSALSEYGVTVSFGEWMAVAVPVLTCVCVAQWAVLLALFGVPRLATEGLQTGGEPLSMQQYGLILLSALFLVVCILEAQFKPLIGDSGNAGLLLTAIAFSSGALKKQDFFAMPWDVFFVLFGVNCLSFCLRESGLARALAAAVVPTQLYDVNLWLEVVKFSAGATVCGSLTSHSMVTSLTMPVVVALGLKLYSPMQFSLLLCLSVVAGMATPYSSLDLLMTWQFGEEKGGLQRKDLIRAGLPATAAAWLVLVTVGFGWSTAVLGSPPEHIIIRQPQQLQPSVEVWDEDAALDDKLRWLERKLDDPEYAVVPLGGEDQRLAPQGAQLSSGLGPWSDGVVELGGLAPARSRAARGLGVPEVKPVRDAGLDDSAVRTLGEYSEPAPRVDPLGGMMRHNGLLGAGGLRARRKQDGLPHLASASDAEPVAHLATAAARATTGADPARDPVGSFLRHNGLAPAPASAEAAEEAAPASAEEPADAAPEPEPAAAPSEPATAPSAPGSVRPHVDAAVPPRPAARHGKKRRKLLNRG